ncbi:hypothetical protein [Halosolutus gelatinilyticus]|uniref:hypothetical protein n=1 Tax=Halosolutus gelatinilyticus TaxID=2931975 RepID=UPI001FF40E1A|nr:hypothetical protein [Halosolutus gelatinilyticus]
MKVDDRILEAAFTRLPKHRYPEPDEDDAIVDFDAGPHDIVVLGHARNGDSRHHFAPEEVRLGSDGDQETLSVTMRITRNEAEDQLILTGPTVYYYRLRVAFDGPLPEEYEITHLDEDGDAQFEVKEMLMVDSETYLEAYDDRRADRDER